MAVSTLSRTLIALASTAAVVTIGASVAEGAGAIRGTSSTETTAPVAAPGDADPDDGASIPPTSTTLPLPELSPEPPVGLTPAEQRELIGDWSTLDAGDTLFADCRTVVERALVAELGPGIEGHAGWFEPDGDRVALRNADGTESPFIDLDVLEATADRVVLATLDADDAVVRYDVDQRRLAEAIEPCRDEATALDVIVASDLVDVHSVFLASSETAEGIRMELRVEAGTYSDEEFTGTFEGPVPSEAYDTFLAGMPAGVRAEVEFRVADELDRLG